MRLFGMEIKRAEKALSPVSDWRSGWRIISEPFSGAWQRNQSESRGEISCYPTLYACLHRISSDIGKLPFQLKRRTSEGTWAAEQNPAYSPVLRKPNKYQTEQQFREAWVTSKLMSGNTYVLKGRDERGVVNALYVLDPWRVQPMVSDSGSVFYQLNYGSPENLLPLEYTQEQIIVPAREMIHDRMNCLHHQLIGVSPLCAANWPAVKNLKILRSSAQFFGNNAAPGGILTAPAGMKEDDAKAIKEYWDTNFGGENSGKVAVVGADMKFTAFAFKAADSQLVEQMRYSDEQICQPFGVPPFKVGIGSIPAGLGVDAINLLYHEDALSGHIEAMENLLDEALGLAQDWGIWLDTSPLFRMDEGKQADVATKLVGGGVETPNEGRRRFNLPALEGGDTVYMQQQDYPLDQVRLNKIEQPAQAQVPQEDDESSDEDLADRARVASMIMQKEWGPVLSIRELEAYAKAFAPVIDSAIAQQIEPLLQRLNALEERRPEKGERGERGADGSPGRDAEAVDADAIGDDVVVKLLGSDRLETLIDLAVARAVNDYFAANPVKHGRDGEQGQRGEKGDQGNDGVGLAGAVIDRNGSLVVTLTNGEAKTLGPVVGADGRDGKDGVDGLSFADFAGEYIPERGYVLRASCGDVQKEFDLPYLQHCGFWSQGKATPAAASVTHDGALWIAKRATKAKPCMENADDWYLAARKGRDGRDGRNGIDKTVAVSLAPSDKNPGGG